MLKKIITTSLLGVCAFNMMAANADVRNVPDDKNNNRYKQTEMNVSPASKDIGFAKNLYVTAQAGYADTHLRSNTKGPSPLDNNGLAGRLALGYNFNQIFALELGYTQFQEGKLNLKDLNTHFEAQQYAVDIAGKGTYPITHNVNLYGKLGVAYLTTRLTETDNDGSYNINDGEGVAKHKLAPEIAVGMNYAITPNVSVDASLTHIQPLGSNRPGNIDFLAVGIGYNFG